LEAFPVYDARGAWGGLATALLDWGKDFDYVIGWNDFDSQKDDKGASITGVGDKLIAANILEIVMVILWVGGFSAHFNFPLRRTGILKAHTECPDEGLDEKKHSPLMIRTYGSSCSAFVFVLCGDHSDVQQFGWCSPSELLAPPVALLSRAVITVIFSNVLLREVPLMRFLKLSVSLILAPLECFRYVV